MGAGLLALAGQADSGVVSLVIAVPLLMGPSAGTIYAGHYDVAMKRIKMRAWVVVHFLNKTLVEDLVDTVKATTYNNTCKDDIDRGVVPHRFHDLTNALEQLDIWNS